MYLGENIGTMRKIAKSLLLIALSLFVLGATSCAPYFEYIHIDGPDGPGLAPEAVKIYPRYSIALKDVKVTGMIKYSCKNEAKVWDNVKRMAAEHGANAAYLSLYKGIHDEFKGRGVVYTFKQ
jgi:hypothetical protein